MRTRLTLARAFLLLMAALAAVLGGLVYVQGTALRAAVADSAAVQRDAASEQVRARVTAYLGQADAAVEAFGARLRAGSCPLDDLAAIESCLFAAAAAESNREPALGGRLEDLSVLFTDVRGFTSLAETLEPDRLARLLGHYFSAMTAGVHDAHGTVDKYIGDAVMAIWNAPRPCADHPAWACRAALACVVRTRALFASEAWEGLPALVTRFGIHRDRVMVGHFGAPDRFSFTAIGDGVNLAARLEGLNKLYGTTILVSDAIERDARGQFAFRRVDRVAVKGKSIGIEVHELLGEPDTDPARLAAARSYERALDAYFARDFDRALAGLGELADLADDGPARVLAARCEALRRAPPPPGWDGTFAATEK
jgi:adenylate cyclase